MKLADDWQWSMNKLDHVHPKFNTTLLLPFEEPLDRTSSSCLRRPCRRPAFATGVPPMVALRARRRVAAIVLA